jgi:hypothetical protein
MMLIEQGEINIPENIEEFECIEAKQRILLPSRVVHQHE